MSGTLYIAGASAEVDMVVEYAAKAAAIGWHQTFEWWRDVLENRKRNVPDVALTDKERERLSRADLEGVARAEVVWLIIPPPGRSAGAWLELGAAIATKKRIIVSGDWRRSIFTSLAERRFDTHDEALAWLRGAS